MKEGQRLRFCLWYVSDLKSMNEQRRGERQEQRNKRLLSDLPHLYNLAASLTLGIKFFFSAYNKEVITFVSITAFCLFVHPPLRCRLLGLPGCAWAFCSKVSSVLSSETLFLNRWTQTATFDLAWRCTAYTKYMPVNPPLKILIYSFFC